MSWSKFRVQRIEFVVSLLYFKRFSPEHAGLLILLEKQSSFDLTMTMMMMLTMMMMTTIMMMMMTVMMVTTMMMMMTILFLILFIVITG